MLINQIGHFYFGKNRTFLNWLDTSPSEAEFLQYFTDPERHPLRKSAARSAIYKL